jgi:hypothetical protein
MVNVTGVIDPVAYQYVHFFSYQESRDVRPCTNHTSVMNGNE